MSVSLGVQFPNAITNLDSNVIIRKTRAKVNRANKKAPKWFTSRGLQLPKLVQTIIDAKNSVSPSAKIMAVVGSQALGETLSNNSISKKYVNVKGTEEIGNAAHKVKISESGVDTSAVDGMQLTKKQTAQITALEPLAKALGVRFHLFDSRTSMPFQNKNTAENGGVKCSIKILRQCQ